MVERRNEVMLRYKKTKLWREGFCCVHCPVKQESSEGVLGQAGMGGVEPGCDGGLERMLQELRGH